MRAPARPDTSKAMRWQKSQRVASSGIYQYETLDTGFIRILHLLPTDNFDDDLECQISEVPLSANSYYSALSYVWGEEQNSHHVFIGNKRLPIARNLDSALRHLRQPDLSVTLWVDALCINQTDIEERNHQVHQMRDIYAGARDTIIYIGDQTGGNTGDSAWNFLERNSAWAIGANKKRDYKLPLEREELLSFRGDWRDVYHMVLSRDWFTRVWVLQEAVVSKELSIQCGERCVPWDDFVKSILLQSRTHDRYGDSLRQENKFDNVRRIWEARVAYQLAHGRADYLPSWAKESISTANTTTNILTMLTRARQLEASDARDKIFALLGISTGFDWASNGTIDYSKPMTQVYTDFARDFIATSKDLSILSYLDSRPVGPRSRKSRLGVSNRKDVDSIPDEPPENLELGTRTKELPSWVPDWQDNALSLYNPRAIIELITDSPSLSLPAFMTQLPPQWEETVRASARNELIVQGRVLGRVREEQCHLRIMGKTEAGFEWLKERWQANPHLQKHPLQYFILAMWARLFDWGGYPRSNGWRMVKETAIASSVLQAQDPDTHRSGSPPLGPAMPSENKETGSFLGFIDLKTFPPAPDSIEQHLIARAHQTVEWTDVRNPAAEVVTDRNSIIDGRTISLYDEPVPADQQMPSSPASDAMPYFNFTSDAAKLVLLPGSSKLNDLIICIPGTKVPFIFRPDNPAIDFDDVSLKGRFRDLTFIDKMKHCLKGRLIGECWINKFDQVVKDPEDFDSLFVIS